MLPQVPLPAQVLAMPIADASIVSPAVVVRVPSPKSLTSTQKLLMARCLRLELKLMIRELLNRYNFEVGSGSGDRLPSQPLEHSIQERHVYLLLLLT